MHDLMCFVHRISQALLIHIYNCRSTIDGVTEKVISLHSRRPPYLFLSLMHGSLVTPNQVGWEVLNQLRSVQAMTMLKLVY